MSTFDAQVGASRIRWIAVSAACAPLILLAAVAALAAPAGLLAATITNGDAALLRYVPLALAGFGLGALALESVVTIPHAFRIRYLRRRAGRGDRAEDVRIHVRSTGVVELSDRAGELTRAERLGGPLGVIDRHPAAWLIGVGALTVVGVIGLVLEAVLTS